MTGTPNKSASSNASSDSPRIGTFKPQPASRLGTPICNKAMKIPVGSKQRSVWLTPLQLLLQRVAKGDSEDPELYRLYEEATRYTIERFEAASSPVVTDGEQRRYHNFATYRVHGLPNTASDGSKILFSDGHTRRLLRLTRGPFRCMRYADCYVDAAMRYAAEPWLIQLQQKS